MNFIEQNYNMINYIVTIANKDTNENQYGSLLSIEEQIEDAEILFARQLISSFPEVFA